MFKAWTKLSRIFNVGTADNIIILSAYKDMLSTTIEDDEVIPLVTLWFRQILACQVDAFALYASMQLKSDTMIRETVRKQALEFEQCILNQIEANKNYIDQNLIFKSLKEIDRQVQETKTKKQFALEINNHYNHYLGQ